MSYIINQLKQISPNIPDINYDFALNHKQIITPYISYLLTISKDNEFNKKSETMTEYIFDISLLLTAPREKLLKKIIKNKRKKLLDYCIERNIIENNIYKITELVVKYDDIQLFELYYKTNNEILSNHNFQNMVTISIQNGSIDCLKFIYETKKIQWEWTSEMCNIAIKNNKIESLKFIFENTLDKCPWNELSFAYACEIGNMDIVEYLYNNKCKVDYISTLYASKGNHFEIIKYLYSRGVSLYSDICLYATINNNLDMLIYAHKNGCNIDSKYLDGKLCYYALLNNNIHMLNYLIINGCSFDKNELYETALKKINISEESEIVKYIIGL
jgi:hypothetical protein